MLKKEDIERIHERSLDILERIGVAIQSKKAIELLLEHGCTHKNGRIYYPPSLVERITSIEQDKVTLYSRTGESITSGEGGVHVHNFGAVSRIFDLDSGEERKALQKDARDLVRLMDSLEHVDAITPIVYPQDIEQDQALLYALWETVKNTTKPVTGPGISTLAEAHSIYEIFLALSGTERRLRERPLYTVGISPKSPLSLPEDDLEAVMWTLEKGIPVAVLPNPIAGMTAPLPLLGALTQQNAEILATLTIFRLIDPSVPISYAARLVLPEMSSGSVFSGSPETAVVGACAVQLAKYYGLESNVYGAATSSFLCDMQMGLEKTINTILPLLAGSDWLSGLGSLGSEAITSYQQLVVDNELFDAAFYLLGSIQEEREDLGFTTIEDVIKGRENFLTHENTLKHLHSRELFHRMRTLGNSRDYASWQAKGGKSILHDAREKVYMTLKNHQVEPPPEEVEREIQAMIDGQRST